MMRKCKYKGSAIHGVIENLVGEEAIVQQIYLDVAQVDLQFDNTALGSWAYGSHKFSIYDVEFIFHEHEAELKKDYLEFMERLGADTDRSQRRDNGDIWPIQARLLEVAWPTDW